MIGCAQHMVLPGLEISAASNVQKCGTIRILQLFQYFGSVTLGCHLPTEKKRCLATSLNTPFPWTLSSILSARCWAGHQSIKRGHSNLPISPSVYALFKSHPISVIRSRICPATHIPGQWAAAAAVGVSCTHFLTGNLVGD